VLYRGHAGKLSAHRASGESKCGTVRGEQSSQGDDVPIFNSVQHMRRHTYTLLTFKVGPSGGLLETMHT
jgi:hypothetical protein